nr:hypothetical protein [Zooshikella ganghwensis]
MASRQAIPLPVLSCSKTWAAVDIGAIESSSATAASVTDSKILAAAEGSCSR